MKEVDHQDFVIKTVREAGGAANKLSNRFLSGIPDLLIKLPYHPAMLLEAKLAKFAATTSVLHQFKLDVTPLQFKTLKDYSDAGMCCGVLSFVAHGKGAHNLRHHIFGLDSVQGTGHIVNGYIVVMIGNHYLPANTPTARRDAILKSLREFAK